MKSKMFVLICALFFPIISIYALEDKVITVTVGEVDVPVYNVTVTWESMEFTYNEQINYIWDNVTHTYELKESTYYWDNRNNNINIINKSSYSIDVALKYNSVNEDVVGNFNKSNATIFSGGSMDFELILDGKLLSNNTNYVKVGTIELMIS